MTHLKNNDDALAALRFIKEFKLSPDQVMTKYSIEDVDRMSELVGLEVLNVTQEEKVFRLMTALYPIRFSLLFKDTASNSAVDRTILGAQQSAEVQAIAKGRCWSC